MALKIYDGEKWIELGGSDSLNNLTNGILKIGGTDNNKEIQIFDNNDEIIGIMNKDKIEFKEAYFSRS